MKPQLFFVFLFLFSTPLLTSCQTSKGNVGHFQTYNAPSAEAKWIRNGEPIEFEETLWYPADGVENLLDSEVQPVGEYRNIEFFVENVDVRPYDRLYTKFARNQFRYFEKRIRD